MLAISNLAWDKSEDKKVLRLLKKYNIQGIEVACSKVSNIKEYKKIWGEQNIKIVATTSLLYGHPELTLFENSKIRKKTFEYLKKQADIANILGAKVMMFGSPKNRIKGKLSNQKAYEISREFFNKLCDYTSQLDISIAFEGNPIIYGGDFINTTKEAIVLAKFINHKYFGINLDASTICSNNEGYDATVKNAIPYAKHAHISEPFLKPIPANETDHKAFASALKKHKYNNWLSIEMPLGADINRLKQIKKTLEFTLSIYC